MRFENIPNKAPKKTENKVNRTQEDRTGGRGDRESL